MNPRISSIFMDHSSQINKPPTTVNRKKEIGDWLTLNNIPYPANATKAMMLVLEKQNKPDPVYEIHSLLEEHGHRIL